MMQQECALKGKTILLVDDEPSIRTVMSAVLEQSGYGVDTAADGFIALRKFQEAKPNMVISDLRMPNMNGFELLSILRARYPEIPTIAISGEFLPREAAEGLLADAFFQKGGYLLDDFLKVVEELLLHAPMKDRKPAGTESRVWSPTGDAPVMLTCNYCLRSFPLEVDGGGDTDRVAQCIFCGNTLEVVEHRAVGLAKKSGR